MEHSLKILILEDSQADAEIVQRLVKKELPHTIVHVVMNKTLFLEALSDFMPDLILSDNSLPQLNALDALKISRGLIPFVPFIMVTGTVSEEFAVEIIKAGADDYILKDRLTRLPAAINAVLKNHKAEKEKQEALKRQKQDEEKYRMLVERVSDGFMALDTQWEIVYINQVAEKMMNREPGSLLGKNLWNEYPELIDRGFHRAYHVAMETQKNARLTEYLSSYNIWVEAKVYPSLTGISVFFSDVTEQKKIEQLSQALEKEKELSELKSGFVSMASHEFRTPLSTIISSIYLLEKYTTTEEQPKREKHLSKIKSSIVTLTDILNDFLSLSKIEEGKIRIQAVHFNMAEVVLSIVEEIKIKKGQEFTYQHKGAVNVLLDISLLKHIVMNLVSNASKFSPEVASIEINTSFFDGRITISVKDHGIGISKEDQEHLMERFFRGSNAGNVQGTGLGLHIVSKYAELMNGSVTCKSELNKGTEFIVSMYTDAVA